MQHDNALTHEIKQQILKGGAFLVGREFMSLLLGLIGVFIITRIIGPVQYGSYAAAFGVYQYLVSLSQGGIGIYLVRVSDTSSERSFFVASTLLLIIALFLFALLQAGTGTISSWMNVAGFDILLRALLLSLPFQTLSVAATAKLERALDFKRIATVELASQLIYYTIALPMALAGFGVASLVTAWCVQQVATCILLHLAAGYIPRLIWDAQIASDIGRYSIGFCISAWTWQLRTLINPFIVGHFMDARAVGYVGLSIRIVEMLTVAKMIVWRLSVAALARIQNNKKALLTAINYGAQLQTLAIAPPLLAFAWFGGWLIPLLFGSQWTPVVELFPFIALSYLINAQFSMHAAALYVLHRNLDVFLFNFSNVVLFAAASWLAIPKFGILGYGWGEVVAFISYLLLHRSISRLLGSPNYRVVAIWCVGTTLGLYWRHLGLWAIGAPFVALLWPSSLMRLRWFWAAFWGREHLLDPETKP